MGIWDRGVRFECFTPAQVRAFAQFIRLDKAARESSTHSSEPTAPAGDRPSQIPDLTTLAPIGQVA